MSNETFCYQKEAGYTEMIRITQKRSQEIYDLKSRFTFLPTI